MLDEHKGSRRQNSLLSIAVEIDRIASTKSCVTSRNLKANADLYGCFFYTALYLLPSLLVTADAVIASEDVVLVDMSLTSLLPC